MSETPHYDYGTSLCSVRENQKLVVEDCDPETVGPELRAANFVRDGSKFVKRRPRLRTAGDGNADSKGLQVLSARIVDDTLHVEPADIVGIVRLVPGMSVQVEPKVGWEHVVRMLLTVYDIDRTQSYYGVPLDELTDGGVESARIIAILAINYVHGVRTIRREGFVRNHHIRRRNGFEGLGSVDVERTLLNHASGDPTPTWIATTVEYANPVNAAIHMAGKLLLRLLQQDRDDREHPRRDALLSLVHQEVEHMEALGIESSQKHLGEYRRMSLHDLPRQRHYYRRAFHTAQSVLSSTLLGQAGGGTEELLVDYALGMNALFEDYSHRVLAQTVDDVRELDHLQQLSAVECEREPSLDPFGKDTKARHKPDHLLRDDGDVLAVLDSKYYRKGKNPAMESGSRSRMFSYAYLTGTDRMAFLCPNAPPERLPVPDTGGEIRIVSPDDGFTCDDYEQLLRKYVSETLAVEYPELRVFEAVADDHLCLSGASDRDLTRVHDTNGPFSISNPTTFADRVIAAITFSAYAPNKSALENQGLWTKSRIRQACTKTDDDGHPKYPRHETTCVPVYDPAGDDDHGEIRLYFLRASDDGTTVAEEGPWSLM